ncbi:MAG: alpha-ketoglutarate-dependent dioxygenase AlkB [Myxococcota bacterium]
MFSAPQLTLFGRETASFDQKFRDIKRLELGRGAWVDRVPGWVRGHATLFEELSRHLDWRTERRQMYERIVEVPRLLADPALEAQPPLVVAMASALSAWYDEPLRRVTYALYRDGRDSVAFHQDKVLRDQAHALVAVVSLGGPRSFHLRPLGGGASRSFSCGWGDLTVMGGTCQRFFEHGIPKVSRAPARLAVMFRSVNLR